MRCSLAKYLLPNYFPGHVTMLPGLCDILPRPHDNSPRSRDRAPQIMLLDHVIVHAHTLRQSPPSHMPTHSQAVTESVCMWEGGDCLRVCGHDMEGW